MRFVFAIDFVDGFLKIKTFVNDGEYLSVTKRTDELLSISLFDSIVFRLELQINLGFLLNVKEVCCYHLSERIDFNKHRFTFNAGTLFENEELTGIIACNPI